MTDSAAADPHLYAVLVEKHTGQNEVLHAAKADELYRNAGREAQQQRRRWRRHRIGLLWGHIHRAAARYGIHPVLDSLIVSSVLTFLAAIIWIVLLGGDLISLMLLVAVGFGGVGGTVAWLLWDSEAMDRASRLANSQRRLHAAHHRCEELDCQATGAELQRNTYARLVAGLTAAQREHERRLRKVDEIEQLLSVDCRLLSGTQFEQYLTSVFRLHGYEVQHTGQSGDQGVDLIIVHESVRIAVQAKCYSGSVGNDAVQQAHAGKSFYDCHTCAVVTNSTFTRSAVELATKLSCILIDGTHLRDLIQGRMRL